MRTRLLRQALLVAAVAVLCGLASVALSAAQPKRFEAVASMRYDVSSLSPDLAALDVSVAPSSLDAQRRLSTEAAGVSSRTIAGAVAADLDIGLDQDDVVDAITVTPSNDSDVIEVRAVQPTRARAKLLLNTYLDAYLGQRREHESARASAALRALGPSATAGRGASKPKSKANATPTPTPVPTSASTPTNDAVELVRGRLRVILQSGTGSPQILDRVRAKSSAAQPQLARNAAFGLLVGALLGVGLVALRRDVRRPQPD